MGCNQYVIRSIATFNPSITGTIYKIDSGTPNPTNFQTVAILREYSNSIGIISYALPPQGDGNAASISGISIDLGACINAHYAVKDSAANTLAIQNATEIYKYIGTSGVLPSVTAAQAKATVAQNSVGEISTWSPVTNLSVGTWTIPSSNAKVPVAVFVGESNAEGRVLNSSATTAELLPNRNARIWNPEKGRLDTLDIGTNNIWNYDVQFQTNKALWHGWELEYSQEATTRIGANPIYIVKSAQGGSTIAEWAAASFNYTTLTNRLDSTLTELKNNKKEGQIYFNFSIGINDATVVTSPATFSTNLQDLFNRLRTKYGSTTPVFITRIMRTNASYQAIDDTIAEIALRDPYTWAITTSDASLIDANHWDYTGMKLIASRMITHMMDTVGINGLSGRSLIGATVPNYFSLASTVLKNDTGQVSRLSITPKAATSTRQTAAFEVTAFGNPNKKVSIYYNNTGGLNRGVISAVTEGVSLDTMQIGESGAVVIDNLTSTTVNTSNFNVNAATINGLTANTIAALGGTLTENSSHVINSNFSGQNSATFAEKWSRSNKGAYISIDPTTNSVHFNTAEFGVSNTSQTMVFGSQGNLHLFGSGTNARSLVDVNGLLTVNNITATALATGTNTDNIVTVVNGVFKSTAPATIIGIATNAQLTPANAGTATINYNNANFVYQSIASPGSVTYDYTNATAGGTYQIEIAPTGSSSTVTFTSGKFLSAGVNMGVRTFTENTVLTFRQISTSVAVLVGVKTTIAIPQYVSGTFNTVILTASGATGTISVSGLTTATGKVTFMGMTGTKITDVELLGHGIETGVIRYNIRNFSVSSQTPNYTLTFRVDSL